MKNELTKLITVHFLRHKSIYLFKNSDNSFRISLINWPYEFYKLLLYFKLHVNGQLKNQSYKKSVLNGLFSTHFY